MGRTRPGAAILAASAALAAAWASPASAQGGLVGRYYNEPAGTPPAPLPPPPGSPIGGSGTATLALTRTDPQVVFVWGGGAPGPGVNRDFFSVAWTGWITPPVTDAYAFFIIRDDGVRLWVNNALLIDRWEDSDAAEVASAPVALTAGVSYPIRVEFYENGGEGTCVLQWSSPRVSKTTIPQTALSTTPGAPAPPPPPGGTGIGLEGRYYNEPTGTPPAPLPPPPGSPIGGSGTATLALTRTDPQVAFVWGDGSPGAGVRANYFTASWTGWITPPVTDAYAFFIIRDDGVRLWVNNALLIDRWEDSDAAEVASAPVALTAGVSYPIRVEFYENAGQGTCMLQWSSPRVSKTTIPQTALSTTPGSGGGGGGGSGGGGGGGSGGAGGGTAGDRDNPNGNDSLNDACGATGLETLLCLGLLGLIRRR